MKHNLKRLTLNTYMDFFLFYPMTSIPYKVYTEKILYTYFLGIKIA